MTQVTTQSPIAVPARSGPTRTAWIVALLALTAAVVVALVIAVGGDSSADAPAGVAQAQPGLRADGGPEESGVAAAIGAQRSAQRPDESRIAAAISTAAR